jgi:hypothetical protein
MSAANGLNAYPVLDGKSLAAYFSPIHLLNRCRSFSINIRHEVVPGIRRAFLSIVTTRCDRKD